jgi:hypothetical protein
VKLVRCTGTGCSFHALLVCVRVGYSQSDNWIGRRPDRPHAANQARVTNHKPKRPKPTLSSIVVLRAMQVPLFILSLPLLSFLSSVDAYASWLKCFADLQDEEEIIMYVDSVYVGDRVWLKAT